MTANKTQGPLSGATVWSRGQRRPGSGVRRPGPAAGDLEVLADELAVQVKGRLSAPLEEQYPGLAA